MQGYISILSFQKKMSTTREALDSKWKYVQRGRKFFIHLRTKFMDLVEF